MSIAATRHPTICSSRIPADCNTGDQDTGESKNPFQPIMWVVKRKGLIVLKMGISMVVRIVKRMITLIVETIGPIEFSAKMESRKESAATVVMAMAAKPKAAKYRQSTSAWFSTTTSSLLRIIRSPVPKIHTETSSARKAIQISNSKV